MRILILAATACLLAACSSDSSDSVAPATASTSTNSGSWFWPFGGSSDDQTASDMPQLGVNSYLWRATLDTLNFMPLASADPVGGVVISDWYAAPDKPDEHLKVTVYILDKRLRADAVKVSVFRQVRNTNGWADAAVNPDTGIKLENAILARARELRLATTPQ
jgi:ABC-type oligopeptide transport system substrate-binding subunit